MKDGQTQTAVELSRQVHLASTIALVDGITRTGKSMMGPILASFDRVEIERVEEILEFVGALHRMKKIEWDAAVALLKLQTDVLLYNSVIGRNTNFRLGDHSGVWRNPNRIRYVRRLLGAEGKPVLQRMLRQGLIFQNQTHDQLANFDLLYDAFQERLRIVEMIRHPVDLADSWIRRGWGDRHGSDPLAFTFCFRHQGEELPYYALGWEDEYLSASGTGRVIRMITSLWDQNQSAYDSLDEECKAQVLIIPFEDFVQRPDSYLGPIGDLLGTRPTRHTPSALRRQKCPRTLSAESRKQKRASLEGEASPDERLLLARLEEEYESVSAASVPRDA